MKHNDALSILFTQARRGPEERCAGSAPRQGQTGSALGSCTSTVGGRHFGEVTGGGVRGGCDQASFFIMLLQSLRRFERLPPLLLLLLLPLDGSQFSCQVYNVVDFEDAFMFSLIPILRVFFYKHLLPWSAHHAVRGFC